MKKATILVIDGAEASKEQFMKTVKNVGNNYEGSIIETETEIQFHLNHK